MSETINIYCDESCHLLNGDGNIMVLGAIWCPNEKRREVFERIREIKEKYGFKRNFEIKWHKVSPARLDFYTEVINYFFDDDDLHFRALVVADKTHLDHDAFNQTHDTFYYKMYFDLLKTILVPQYSYNIYLDIKDTKSQDKVEKLHEVLINSQYDFQKHIVKKMQTVHSHEIELMQIADLLIGAVAYVNRELKTSPAKTSLVQRIQQRTGYSLVRSTLYREDKMNIFIWSPRLKNHSGNA